MKNITMKISIDENAHTVELRRVGCKVPESKIYSDSAEAIASIWRDLAYYATENAFYAEHAKDFLLPDFDRAAFDEMAQTIKTEHKSIFDGCEAVNT